MTLVKYTIPLLALVLLIPAGMSYAIAQEVPGGEELESGEVGTVNEGIDEFGNRGVAIVELLETTLDEQTVNELEAEFEEIKQTMRGLGIPTVGEYEENKSYWRQIAVEHHLSEEESEHNEDSISTVSFVSHTRCNDCNITPEVRFQSGYGYDCYAGIWTCHAYDRNWETLGDGQTGDQTLPVGDDHNWMDPFWLMKANKRLNVTYTYSHLIYNDGGQIVANPNPSGDVQYFLSSSSVRTMDMDRYDDPRRNFSIDNEWTINSIR